MILISERLYCKNFFGPKKIWLKKFLQRSGNAAKEFEMSPQENKLRSLGVARYEERIALRGGRSELAQELGFSNPGALVNCANRVFYNKEATSRKSGGTSSSSTNGVAAIRRALEDLAALGLIKSVPSLFKGSVESPIPNPAIAELIQPFFDAAPLNAAFVLAFRHVPESQLREFGLISPEMRAAEQAAREQELARENEAMSFLRARGYEVVVAERLREEISIWSLRGIETSNFEIGLLHVAEAKEEARQAAAKEAAEKAAKEAVQARLHDAATVAVSISMDATEREKAAIAAAAAAAERVAALEAQLAALKAAS